MKITQGERDSERHAQLIVLLAAAKRRHRESKLMRTVAVWSVVLRSLPEDDDLFGEVGGDAPRQKLRRRVHLRRDYRASFWWRMLGETGLQEPASREARLFRRRFRIPFQFFTELTDLVKEKRWFPMRAKDVAGRQCIPVELKVLSSLHILGRGNFFEDMSQASHMSEAVIQASFHKFNRLFAQEFYHDHVYLPTGEDQDQVMEHYDHLGFTGAIGSTDVTHIKWACCPHSWARQYSGKEGFATIAYQATVDHSGRVLAVTKGFGGAMNDKTIIRFDAAVEKIRKDETYTEKVYTLFDKDGNTVEHKGTYCIVDNGYNKWGILIPPSKYPKSREESRWSKALESIRKDVECFFGILKGRFRILKLGILFQDKDAIDNIFFTCCTLHNMLHSFDGLDELEPTVEWGGKEGLHEPWDNVPLLDESTTGTVSPPINDEEAITLPEESHFVLKNALITHFEYRRRRNDVRWLKHSNVGHTS